MPAIAEIDHMLAAQGKGDPHRLRIATTMPEAEGSAKRAMPAVRRAAPCRHHHGRQWTLGGGARAAARRRAPARRRGACGAPSAPPANSASRFITIFSFSAENWSRPADEVGELMGLLRRFIRNDLAELHQSDVRVRIIGERDGSRSRYRPAAGRSRRAHQRQRRPHFGGRLQLRRAPGNRARGAPHRRGGGARTPRRRPT